MSEMVERVARAMYAAHRGSEPEEWEDLTAIFLADYAEVNFIELATAAIAAMREPTEVMIEAGYERLCNGELPTGPYHWEGWITPQVFRDMIDAALK